jgi:hypothetical protein
VARRIFFVCLFVSLKTSITVDDAIATTRHDTPRHDSFLLAVLCRNLRDGLAFLLLLAPSPYTAAAAATNREA